MKSFWIAAKLALKSCQYSDKNDVLSTKQTCYVSYNQLYEPLIV